MLCHPLDDFHWVTIFSGIRVDTYSNNKDAVDKIIMTW